MANVSGNAYALTVLSPIRNGLVSGTEIAHADAVRNKLQNWNQEFNSPMALVPETYLCRFYVLDDVVTESLPGGSVLDTWSDLLPVVPDGLRRRVMPVEEHLQSAYLVFTSNFYCGPAGTPDAYLRGMWEAINRHIQDIWQHCYGYDAVHDAHSFCAYMQRCQLTTSLFFVGTNDQPLAEQLKALYLKQEFSKFAIANQGLSAAAIRTNYRAFMQRVEAGNLSAPSWQPGQYRL